MTMIKDIRQPEPRMSVAPYLSRLNEVMSRPWHGKVVVANGQHIESTGLRCSVGEICQIVDHLGSRHLAEVIGFSGSHVVTMPLVDTKGIRYGDKALALGRFPSIAINDKMLGSVINALGERLDEEAHLPSAVETWPLDSTPPGAMERVSITDVLPTGIRALDGMLTIGRGQRIGIFGGSGVGKSTLIGMMARNTAADLTIVGLVGERGREVREFIEDSLGNEGKSRSVVVVATSDESPILRMRAASAATSIAEYYASKGRHVLLVIDSLTRYAMAAREVGLTANEPPTTKGYTPSVFTRLSKLVERAGSFKRGSITAFYTVLMEGDDQQDPIVDAVRSFLDGHVVLSRQIASAGHYPPIDILDSLSRLMPAVTTREHYSQAAAVRNFMAVYARSEDLIRIGAYSSGSDREVDHAVQAMPSLHAFLRQSKYEFSSFEDTVTALGKMEL
jgi:flagellum-specific ATP synthase